MALAAAVGVLAILLMVGCLRAAGGLPLTDDGCRRPWVSFDQQPGYFPLYTAEQPATLHLASGEDSGVVRAAHDLAEDIFRVTGARPRVEIGAEPANGRAVVIGTIGKSKIIDRLANQGRLDVSNLADAWGSFVVEVLEQPSTAVDRTLVVAGSDRRGTIYGLYTLSQHIGVSPWTWWADVPVRKRNNLFVRPDPFRDGPVVRYRGIFINDENPALLGWVNETFGGFNRLFYEKVFELILRMKGNYLWPAMWGKAFADDDSLNARLADEYGIVMGTSHHEPLMRAHVEWSRYGSGPWNYETNEDALKAFWREGIRRMGTHESIVTVGMRGDGDEPMTEETAITLLERIVADQRTIIEGVTGQDEPVHLRSGPCTRRCKIITIGG